MIGFSWFVCFPNQSGWFKIPISAILRSETRVFIVPVPIWQPFRGQFTRKIRSWREAPFGARFLSFSSSKLTEIVKGLWWLSRFVIRKVLGNEMQSFGESNKCEKEIGRRWAWLEILVHIELLESYFCLQTQIMHQMVLIIAFGRNGLRTDRYRVELWMKYRGKHLYYI